MQNHIVSLVKRRQIFTHTCSKFGRRYSRRNGGCSSNEPIEFATSCIADSSVGVVACTGVCIARIDLAPFLDIATRRLDATSKHRIACRTCDCPSAGTNRRFNFIIVNVVSTSCSTSRPEVIVEGAISTIVARIHLAPFLASRRQGRRLQVATKYFRSAWAINLHHAAAVC